MSCKELSLLWVKSQQKRVGFSVSKKVGCAVVRNRIKRRLRECVRPLLPYMKNGLYVLVARPAAAESSFDTLKSDVGALAEKLELLRKTEPAIGAKP